MADWEVVWKKPKAGSWLSPNLVVFPHGSQFMNCLQIKDLHHFSPSLSNLFLPERYCSLKSTKATSALARNSTKHACFVRLNCCFTVCYLALFSNLAHSLQQNAEPLKGHEGGREGERERERDSLSKYAKSIMGGGGRGWEGSHPCMRK